MPRSLRRLLAAAVTAVLLVPVPAAASPAGRAAPPDGLLYTTTNADGTVSRLLRSDLDGSSATVLSQVASPFLMATPSPDQTRVAVRSQEALEVLPTSGGDPVALDGPLGEFVSASEPIWSPDSTRVAEIRGAEVDGAYQETVHVYAADGGSSGVAYTDDDPDVGGLSPWGWSPDGSQLIYSAYESQFPDPARLAYYRVPAAGGSPVEIPGAVAVYPSPDGTRLFGSVVRGSDMDLVRYSDDLATRTVVHTFHDIYEGWWPQASWSADGSRFAVIGQTLGPDQSLVVLDRDGGAVTVIEDLPWEGTGLHYRTPILSPDGTVAGFYADTTTQQYQFEGIYLLDLELDRSCLVTDIYRDGGLLTGEFAHDGATLLVLGGRPKTLDYSQPGGVPVDTAVPADAWVEGVLGSPAPEVDAVPCGRERIARDLRIEPGREGGKRVLHAYVFGVPACDNGVPVKLQRRRADGRWVTLARELTDDQHTATFPAPRDGRLRALAPAVDRGDYACLKGVSQTYRA